MADNTPNLNLPFILPSQAQKHVTHNEALLALDALVHLAVQDELAAPPAMPGEGATYLVAASGSGVWTGRDGRIAVWQDNAWTFLRPCEGWRAWFASAGDLKVFSSGMWRSALPAIAGFNMLGIGATADAVNRLALSSAASLFSHAGDGHQLKINKAEEAATASLLFQSGWTGHAEMGLAGNNDFSIKVSDGNSWKTALAIRQDGSVEKPNQPAMRAYRGGAIFAPASGQQSGFTDLAYHQGGFTLGPALAGGGQSVTIPVDGTYLLCLTMRTASSSGHTISLVENGSQSLLTLAAPAGSSGTQSASGIFTLTAGSALSLLHAGIATFQAGSEDAQISALRI